MFVTMGAFVAAGCAALAWTTSAGARPEEPRESNPPIVEVLAPNGGELLEGNTPYMVRWTASDDVGIVRVDLYLSDDGGETFRFVVRSMGNQGSFRWYPPNRPTTEALVRVVAIDPSNNVGYDDSDAFFSIAAPPGGIVPTTLRDFDMPGTQPLDVGTIQTPLGCAICHGYYDAAVEPFENWRGSMMSQASRDPLFEACMTIANQDAPDSGDLCLRCHIPKGWLAGRSVPTDGSEMLPDDLTGVSCDVCHRLVDLYDDPENPIEDVAILAGLLDRPADFANGMYVIDPSGGRRGPFVDADYAHPILVSPFHREAALCGTCHDVSNPVFERDAQGNYVPNEMDAKATVLASAHLMPIERTYSEWLNSAYNTPEGVYAPQFGGNRDYVATCQHCHMRAITGRGCMFEDVPLREDLPLHDLTGASTWLPGLLPALYPGFPEEVNEAALQAGIERARYMLQNAAEMNVVQAGAYLRVTVTNQTGHKLPTGYPEGRRMWLNVRFYDASWALIGESCAYDAQTGVLTEDGAAKIYEAKLGMDETVAPLVGVDPGPSFHFVLNNRVYKDNRIPPRGFTNAAYASFGGAPVGAAYADGQHWDDTYYLVPAGAVSAEVTLYYQSTSKEYVEFLRDENVTDTKGQEMYALWADNGKCPPEPMRHATLAVTPAVPGDMDGDGDVDAADFAAWAACMRGPGVAYGEGCEPADVAPDGDVDLDDFAVMQRLLGP